MKRRGFMANCLAALVAVPAVLIGGVPEPPKPKKPRRSKPYIREWGIVTATAATGTCQSGDVVVLNGNQWVSVKME